MKHRTQVFAETKFATSDGYIQATDYGFGVSIVTWHLLENEDGRDTLIECDAILIEYNEIDLLIELLNTVRPKSKRKTKSVRK